MFLISENFNLVGKIPEDNILLHIKVRGMKYMEYFDNGYFE
jgi:hypothetical protein